MHTHVQVSRSLFRWTKEIAYADYYERALINGVLSIQRGTDPGVMIYMLPQAPGHSKAVSYHGWGTKYDSFWCCYGTGNITHLQHLSVLTWCDSSTVITVLDFSQLFLIFWFHKLKAVSSPFIFNLFTLCLLKLGLQLFQAYCLFWNIIMISICRYRILFKTWWFYLLWGERRSTCTQYHSVHTKHLQLESSWAYCYSANQNPQLFWPVSSNFILHFCKRNYFQFFIG